MILRGRIVADCVVANGPGQRRPGRHVRAVDDDPGARARSTQIWGNTDVDTFQLGDPSGIDRRRGRRRRHDLGATATSSSARRRSIHGTNTRRLQPTVPERRREPLRAGDPKNDEDSFIVWYLQSMNVVTDPLGLPATRRGAGHVLTLDGQADTDYYTVYTTGSHGSARNYVDQRARHRRAERRRRRARDLRPRQPRPAFNGYVAGTTTRNATDDIFLLRAVEVHRHRDARTALNARRPVDVHVADRDGRPAGVRRAARRQQRPRRRPRPLPRPHRRATSRASKVQRINYDTALNGRLTRLRPGRQRRLLRRRHERDRDPRRRRRLRPLPDRPDLRHQARQRADRGRAAAAGHVPGARSRRPAAG